ncbi:GNAT family N-acetyltransferase [Hymenobacter artigasi]|uniref:Ribosomal protein S18 acetylase RimI-like enzyme n=1 Tax=Hymenobacter artigasi TaxID=2719616 RepID=A0ABX1HCA0_9BACT|nr:GNAT family N-acetyltransferase [Hymenobacter artigasi]NKI87585.1 ribosomal protein S18 acetylase RimI-like enzyme [Hymenobacter artigasi]
MNSAAAIQPPRTPAEWAAYYQLRYAVLRQPWQQPPGSERVPADDEAGTIHALLLAVASASPEALAVGMLQPTGAGQGQIRFMAVAPEAAGRGLGQRVVAYLEEQARAAGLGEIVLHSRQAAVGFYEKLGYAVIEPSHLLFGEIQHFLMRKDL